MTDVGKKLSEMFDIICVVATTRPKLKNYTLRTLDSLGLLTSKNIVSGKVHIQYDMPNIARKIVKDAIPKLNVYNKKDNVFWCTLNHYYALAAAYHSGAEHALIFEDDAVILKDSDEIMRYLENVPADYDFINFGCLPTGGPGGIPNFKNMLLAPGGTEFYAKLENGRNAHSLGMSRKFMEKILLKIEARMTGEEDAELLVND